jgi:hypothetical protein
MTDGTNDDLRAEIDRGLERTQAEEREELAEHLKREFETDEKIIQAIAESDDPL